MGTTTTTHSLKDMIRKIVRLSNEVVQLGSTL